MKGSAASGRDYQTLKGKVKIKANHTSRTVQVIPQGDLGGAGKKTVELVLESGTGYTLGAVEGEGCDPGRALTQPIPDRTGLFCKIGPYDCGLASD